MIQTYTDDPQTEAALAARHPWNALGMAADIADAALFLASDEAYVGVDSYFACKPTDISV